MELRQITELHFYVVNAVYLFTVKEPVEASMRRNHKIARLFHASYIILRA